MTLIPEAFVAQLLVVAVMVAGTFNLKSQKYSFEKNQRHVLKNL